MAMLVEYPAYITLAQDLDSDACEWQVHTGPHAEERAHAHAQKWIERHGERWIAQVRACNARPEKVYP